MLRDSVIRRLWVFIAIVLALLNGVQASPIDAEQIHVIDGDTITIKGHQPSVRLVGFNAPETGRAACKTELELGAKDRLRELVVSSTLDFEYVPCSCPAGSGGTYACNHGRRCGTLRANGQDVGEILVSEGLAVRFICGATSCPKTPRPWCKGD
jgi:micrococcal nuclease